MTDPDPPDARATAEGAQDQQHAIRALVERRARMRRLQAARERATLWTALAWLIAAVVWLTASALIAPALVIGVWRWAL